MQSINARHAPRTSRIPIDDVLIKLNHEDFEDTFEADGINVGEGGLSMRAAILPDVGSRLRCRFESPADGDRVTADCEVVWAQDKGRHMGEFGLRFRELDTHSEATLDRLLDELGERDVAGPPPDPAARETYEVPPVDASSPPPSEHRSPTGGAALELRLDAVATPLVAEVVHRADDAVVVEQELPFLRIGTGVSEESGRRGVLSAVDLRMEGEDPRLVLTVCFDDEPASRFEGDLEKRTSEESAPRRITIDARSSVDVGATAEGASTPSSPNGIDGSSTVDEAPPVDRWSTPIGGPEPAAATGQAIGAAAAPESDSVADPLDTIPDAPRVVEHPSCAFTPVVEERDLEAALRAAAEDSAAFDDRRGDVPQVVRYDLGAEKEEPPRAHVFRPTVERAIGTEEEDEDDLALAAGFRGTSVVADLRAKLLPIMEELRTLLLGLVRRLRPALARARRRLRQGARAARERGFPYALEAMESAAGRLRLFWARLRDSEDATPSTSRRRGQRRTTERSRGQRKPKGADRVDERVRPGARKLFVWGVTLLVGGLAVYGLVGAEEGEVEAPSSQASAASSAGTSDGEGGESASSGANGSRLPTGAPTPAPNESLSRGSSTTVTEPTMPRALPEPEYRAGQIPEPTFPGMDERRGDPPIGPASEGTEAFGVDAVAEGTPFTLQMSTPVRGLFGEATERGFVVRIPGSLSLSRAGPIAANHPHVERAAIRNLGDSSELTIRFVAGRDPEYRVEAHGTQLRVVIGR